MNKKICFIGAGKMATAIYAGALKYDYPSNLITVSCPDDEELLNAKVVYNVNACKDNMAAAKNADIIFLAVKPQIAKQVCKDLIELESKQKKVFVSVMAGVNISSLNSWLGDDVAVIRCMPNTPCLVGCGAFGVAKNSMVIESDYLFIKDFLEKVGMVEEVSESEIDLLTAVSGSSPAYFFLIAEAMEEAAVKMGMEKSKARRLILQTFLGSAKMMSESAFSPSELKNDVMSPNGTTEKAILSLEESGVRAGFYEAMMACENRAKEMAKEFG